MKAGNHCVLYAHGASERLPVTALVGPVPKKRLLSAAISKPKIEYFVHHTGYMHHNSGLGLSGSWWASLEDVCPNIEYLCISFKVTQVCEYSKPVSCIACLLRHIHVQCVKQQWCTVHKNNYDSYELLQFANLPNSDLEPVTHRGSPVPIMRERYVPYPPVMIPWLADYLTCLRIPYLHCSVVWWG